MEQLNLNLESDPKEPIMRNGQRYFKVIDEHTGELFGRFSGQTPKQAASKAFTKICQINKRNGIDMPTDINISMRESTQQSNKKMYRYVASRTELDNPMEFEIKGEGGSIRKITYLYKNTITKIRVPKNMTGQSVSTESEDFQKTFKPDEQNSTTTITNNSNNTYK